MKKILIILLVISFLSGCSQSNENSNENTDNLSQATATTKTDSIIIPVATPENSISATFSPTPSPNQSSNETVFDKNNFKMLYVIGSDVNVRSTYSTKGEILYQMPLNQLVKAFFEKDGWYYIEYREGHYGYMLGKYLSETPSPERTPLPKRDAMLIYNNLPKMPDDADYGGGTYEMMNATNYDIDVCKEKIAQISAKIKDKDSKIGGMVDSLIAKWNKFLPSSTVTYHDLVLEFEPEQGTVFGLVRLGAVLDEYKELLNYLENVYLMMIGYEEYKDLDAEKAKGSKEEYERDFNNVYGNIERLGSEAIKEALHNADGYAAQSQKIADWYSLWDDELGEFFDLKWKILAELDFNKNTKSFDNYKAYDKYEIYNSYNNQFKNILLIMRGEKGFSEE